jgi:hypothetical protein
MTRSSRALEILERAFSGDTTPIFIGEMDLCPESGCVVVFENNAYAVLNCKTWQGVDGWLYHDIHEGEDATVRVGGFEFVPYETSEAMALRGMAD